MATQVWQTGFEKGMQEWKSADLKNWEAGIRKSKIPAKFPSVTIGLNNDPPWRFMRNFYIRHASFPKRRTVLMTLTTKTGPDYVIGYDSKMGRTFAGIGNKTELGGKPPLDKWYRLDLLAECKTKKGTFKWAINGKQIGKISADIKPTEFDRLIYGTNPPSSAMTYWDDEVAFPHAVIKKRRRR